MELKDCKVYVVGGDEELHKWLPDTEMVSDMKEADLVIFGPGPDVSPTYYGEKPGEHTKCDAKRDQADMEECDKAKKLGKKLLGIGRGAQLLTVLAGGKLIQHAKGHEMNGTHMVDTYNGANLYIESKHHQMMYPYNMDKNNYIVIGWTQKKLSDEYLDGSGELVKVPKDFGEVEMALYQNIDAFCIQGHMHKMAPKALGVTETVKLVATFMTMKFKKTKRKRK